MQRYPGVKIHRTGSHSPNVRKTMNRSPHPMAVTFRSNFVTRRHRPQCFDLIAVRCITHTLLQTTSAAESGLRQNRLSDHRRFGATGSWGRGLTRTGEMSNDLMRSRTGHSECVWAPTGCGCPDRCHYQRTSDVTPNGTQDLGGMIEQKPIFAKTVATSCVCWEDAQHTKRIVAGRRSVTLNGSKTDQMLATSTAWATIARTREFGSHAWSSPPPQA